MSVENLEMERAEHQLLQLLRDENDSLGKRVEQLLDINKTNDIKIKLMGRHINALIEENEELRIVNKRIQSKSTNRRKALRSLNTAYAYISARLVTSDSQRAVLVNRLASRDHLVERLDTQIAELEKD